MSNEHKPKKRGLCASLFGFLGKVHQGVVVDEPSSDPGTRKEHAGESTSGSGGSTSRAKKITPVVEVPRHSVFLSPEQYFGLHDGPFLKDLYDLEYSLSAMTREQFRHHTADGRNDFATWVEDVVGERELGRQMREATDREALRGVVKRFLSRI